MQRWNDGPSWPRYLEVFSGSPSCAAAANQIESIDFNADCSAVISHTSYIQDITSGPEPVSVGWLLSTGQRKAPTPSSYTPVAARANNEWRYEHPNLISPAGEKTYLSVVNVVWYEREDARYIAFVLNDTLRQYELRGPN